jgi:hypothetical protein
MYEVAWGISFQEDTGLRSSEGIGIANVQVGALKGKARSYRGEVGNHGRGKPARDPLGCKSEESAAPTDEANNRY